jgi:hypothetical protein
MNAEDSSIGEAPAPGEGAEVKAPDAPTFKQANYELGRAIFKPYVKDAYTLSVPSTGASELTNKGDKLNTVSIKDLGAKGEKWVDVLRDGLGLLAVNKVFDKAITDDSAFFENSPTSGAESLTYSTPRKIDRSGELTGQMALSAISAALGQRYFNLVPLWHSGFWVNFRTPNADAQLELFRKLNESKVKLGRDSYGLAYSNTTVYRNEVVLRFFFEELLESCSLKLPENETDYLKYLKTPDTSLIFAYLAASIFPNGFNFQRACVADPAKCAHVVSGSIDITNCILTNMRKLTKGQKKHMENKKPGIMTVESVGRYQDEFLVMKRSSFSINDVLSIIVTTPSALDQITSGRAWVDSIANDYPDALFESEDARNAFINNKGKATKAYQYAHYIESIKIKDGEIEQDILDKDTISSALATISNDDTQVEKFVTEVQNYISVNNVSFVAIPSYKCPACGGTQVSDDNTISPELIVLDPMRLFFVLMQQHIQAVMSRV